LAPAQVLVPVTCGYGKGHRQRRLRPERRGRARRAPATGRKSQTWLWLPASGREIASATRVLNYDPASVDEAAVGDDHKRDS